MASEPHQDDRAPPAPPGAAAPSAPTAAAGQSGRPSTRFQPVQPLLIPGFGEEGQQPQGRSPTLHPFTTSRDLSREPTTLLRPAPELEPEPEAAGREVTLLGGEAVLDGREATLGAGALHGREATLLGAVGGREATPLRPAGSFALTGREPTLRGAATPRPAGGGTSAGTVAGGAAGVTGREPTLAAGGGSRRPITQPTDLGGRAGAPAAPSGRPRTGSGTSVSFDDAWHLQGRRGPHTGAKWGDFELGGILGEGGMGAVYRAKQVSLKRRVALKVLPPNLAADDKLLQRFHLEARTSSILSSPHVVQVYAIGEHDGNHYFAMEFVEGTDLYDIIKQRQTDHQPFTPDEAADLVVQAAKGLAEAGRHGIVHRDIKPPNLMVAKGNLLKIADFGIVKIMGEHQLTMTGQAVGTPAYCSPEQGRGEAQIDTRSDLYSLGVVFYELLCGRKPFEGTTPNALIYQHCYGEPELPQKLNPLIGDEYQAVVLRCLQKKPEHRYACADDLVKDLESIRAGSMLKSAIAHYRLGTGADEAKREQMNWWQRHLAAVAGAAGLVVVLGGGGVWAWADHAQRVRLAASEEQSRRDIAASEERQKHELSAARLRATLASLDQIAPLPADVEARLDELAAAAGSGDADVARWRAKVTRVRLLAGGLVALDTAEPDAAARISAGADLTAYAALVGTGDAAAERWAARLAQAQKDEDELRAKLGVLDTAALTQAAADSLRPLLAQLQRLVPADDARVRAWGERLAGFDARITALIARIAPLDAGGRITEGQRGACLEALGQLRPLLGAADARVQRWERRLQEAEGLVGRLRAAIGAVLGTVDRPSVPAQDTIEIDLAQLRTLLDSDDPDLKRWDLQIRSANAAIAKLRERLAALDALPKGETAPFALLAPLHQAVDELRGLARPGDADVLRWEAALRVGDELIATLRTRLRRLDGAQAEPIALAQQQALAHDLERLDAKGGVDGEQAAAWSSRLAAEAARVAALRTALAVLDRPASIVEATRSALARLAADAGEGDADVVRWQAKVARVAALCGKLKVLDAATMPDDGEHLHAQLVVEVGAADAEAQRWGARLGEIAAARAAVAPLARIQPLTPTAVADLVRLRALVGAADAGWQRLDAKVARVGELAALLRPLATTYAQAPAAATATHAALAELVGLVGVGDPGCRAWAQRQALLDGPGRPAWASAAGQDEYGPWALVRVGDAEVRFRYVPPGAFRMGSPDDETGREGDEVAVPVTLTQALWLAESECPQRLWHVVTGGAPSRFTGDDRPVDSVSLDDIQAFLAALTRRVPGLPARLPSEAEWEYACRAGAIGPWAAGPGGAQRSLDGLAWYAANSHGESHEVKLRYPNALGLYDLQGNVSEWCRDRYAPYPTSAASDPLGRDGAQGVARGGSWGDGQATLRAANRLPARPSLRSAYLGFRLAAAVQWPVPPDGLALLGAGAATRGQIEFQLGTAHVRVEVALPADGLPSATSAPRPAQATP